MPYPNLSKLQKQGAALPPDLPSELWSAIVNAVESEDPCEEVVGLCNVNREWSGWCRDGSLYDKANRRLGWYGPYQTWAEVLQFYTTKGEPGARNLTPTAYFRKVCNARREIVDLLLVDDNAEYDIQYKKYLGVKVDEGLLSEVFKRELAQERMWRRKVEDMLVHPYGEYLLKVTVQIDGLMLYHVPGSANYVGGETLPAIRNYNTVAKLALKQDGRALEFVSWRRPDYSELACIAVQTHRLALKYVPGNNLIPHWKIPEVADFVKIAKLAVQYDERALEFVTNTDFYEEIRAAIGPNSYRTRPYYNQNWWERENVNTKTFPDWAPPSKFALFIQEANTITEIVNATPMAAYAEYAL